MPCLSISLNVLLLTPRRQGSERVHTSSHTTHTGRQFCNATITLRIGGAQDLTAEIAFNGVNNRSPLSHTFSVSHKPLQVWWL